MILRVYHGLPTSHLGHPNSSPGMANSGMDVATSSSVGPDPVAGSAEAEASESDFDIDIDAEDLIPGYEAMRKGCVWCVSWGI